LREGAHVAVGHGRRLPATLYLTVFLRGQVSRASLNNSVVSRTSRRQQKNDKNCDETFLGIFAEFIAIKMKRTWH
jgi:hypothetical protein